MPTAGARPGGTRGSARWRASRRSSAGRTSCSSRRPRSISPGSSAAGADRRRGRRARCAARGPRGGRGTHVVRAADAGLDVALRRPFVVPQGGEFMRWGSPNLWDMLVSYEPRPVLVDAARRRAWPGSCRSAAAPRVAAARRSCCSSRGTRTPPSPTGGPGEAFGARRFVSCFPLFVLGLAAVLDRWRDRPAALAAAAGGRRGRERAAPVPVPGVHEGLARHRARTRTRSVDLWVERFLVPSRVARAPAGAQVVRSSETRS